MLFLERTPRPLLLRNPGLSIRSSTGEPGLFLAATSMPASTLTAARPGEPNRVFQAMPSTPQTTTQLGRFRPVLNAPKPPNFGAEMPYPLPSPADGVVISEPFWERPAGTQTHSRRTGRKLEQLRCARQGLVRVPESNTKYGGKVGKTGGHRALVMAPSISESSGIPKGKKLRTGCGARLRPLFTGELFIRGLGLHFQDSRKATGTSGLACPRARGRRPR
jgi:hypothetical protein